MITIEKILMNIAEPIIRIEKRLVSLVDDVKKLKEDLIKVNQSLDNLKKAMNKYEEECVTKEHEKKYRPFTLNEFLVTFPMLTDITMREKGDNDCIITCTVTAYRTRIMSADICLGVEWISLKELFDKCEYKNTLGDWIPFGEEIEE